MLLWVAHDRSGLSPQFQKLAEARQLEAWNLPLGAGKLHAGNSLAEPDWGSSGVHAVSHMIRDVAAGRPGPITKTGEGRTSVLRALRPSCRIDKVL